MALSDSINLDTLVFQDLLDEARKNIRLLGLEWTDYNLSDPGITLLELTAAMTEKLAYRINRVPQKSRLKLLEMLGFGLRPTVAAETDVTFWLSTPAPDVGPTAQRMAKPAAEIAEAREIATASSPGDDPIVFTTQHAARVYPVHLRYARSVYRPGFNYATAWARRQHDARLSAFGDACQGSFELGFELPPAAENSSITGYVLRLNITCDEAVVTGIAPEWPPVIWEWIDHENYAIPAWPMPGPAGRLNSSPQWDHLRRLERQRAVDVSALPLDPDGTMGLTRPGAMILYLPTGNIPKFRLQGDEAFWLRCRPDPFAGESDKRYTPYKSSPVITGIQATVLGVSIPARHVYRVKEEYLGESTGEPNQSYQLRNWPVVTRLQATNTGQADNLVDCSVSVGGESWTQCTDFVDAIDVYEQPDSPVARRSMPKRLYTVDGTAGVVRFAPSVVQRNGELRPFGDVPARGAHVYATYSYGGGRRGNVSAGELTVPRNELSGIDRVFNRKRAQHGLDAQSIDDLVMQARYALRAQERAVTARDYEVLTLRGNVAHAWRISRVKCLTPARLTAHNELEDEANMRSAFEEGIVPSRSKDAGLYLRPGQVSLLLVPNAEEPVLLPDGTEALRVSASRLILDQGTIANVVRHIDQHCTLTAYVHVREPNYRVIRARVRVTSRDARTQSEQSALQARIRRAIDVYLSPIDIRTENERKQYRKFEELSYRFRRGEWAWTFGDDVYPSELALLLLQVTGVASVTHVSLDHGLLEIADKRNDVPVLPRLTTQSDAVESVKLQPWELPLCPSAFETAPESSPDQSTQARAEDHLIEISVPERVLQ